MKSILCRIFLFLVVFFLLASCGEDVGTGGNPIPTVTEPAITQAPLVLTTFVVTTTQEPAPATVATSTPVEVPAPAPVVTPTSEPAEPAPEPVATTTPVVVSAPPVPPAEPVVPPVVPSTEPVVEPEPVFVPVPAPVPVLISCEQAKKELLSGVSNADRKGSVGVSEDGRFSIAFYTDNPVKGGEVYNSLMYITSVDGVVATSSKLVTEFTLPGQTGGSVGHALYVEGNVVHVSWNYTFEDFTETTVYQRSEDQGKTWSFGSTVDTGGKLIFGGQSGGGVLVINGDKVFFIFDDGSKGLRMTQLFNDGNGWVFSQVPVYLNDPSLTASADLHNGRITDSGAMEVFFNLGLSGTHSVLSSNDGASWTGPVSTEKYVDPNNC